MPFFTRLLLLVVAGTCIALARKSLDQQRNTQAAGSGLSTAAHPPASAALADTADAAALYLLPASARLAGPYFTSWPCAADWPGQRPATKPAGRARPWQL